MKIPPKVIKLIKKYKEILKLNDYGVKLTLVADYEYIVKTGREIKTPYEAEIVDCGKKQFLLIIPQSSLKENIEEIIIHELLHIFFWNYVEKVKSLIEIMDDWHTNRRSRLKEEIDTVEHLWIDSLTPLIKR